MASASIWSKAVLRKDPANSKSEDRIRHAQAGGVLSQIENATEAILKKHEKKSA
jgi:hypothetical protein